MTPKGSPVPRSRFGINIVVAIAVVVVVPAPVADHRYLHNLRRHRRQNLSTFIIILTRVLSASTSSSSTASCVLWQGQDRTAHGARCARHTLVQVAASSVETPGCCGDSDNFHQFNLTPEILVGNAVADALAKKGTSVFPAANDWVKMDQIAWAVQQRIYATGILAAQSAPRSVSAHPEGVLLAARRIRKSESTILENASTHSLVPVGKGYHCRV